MQEYYQEYVFRFWEYLLKANNLQIILLIRPVNYSLDQEVLIVQLL